MFFSYDPNDGWESHSTAEEARKRAQESLDFYTDDASDGWEECVEQVCWGEIKGQVVEKSRRPVRPDENLPFDEVVDYALVDLESGNSSKQCSNCQKEDPGPVCSCGRVLVPNESGGEVKVKLDRQAMERPNDHYDGCHPRGAMVAQIPVLVPICKNCGKDSPDCACGLMAHGVDVFLNEPVQS